MRKLVLCFAIAGALTVVGIGLSASSASQKAPSLTGGGHAVQTVCNATCHTFNRDFSVDAHQTTTGATGTLYYGQGNPPGNETPGGVVVDVRCLTVSGTTAVVGGVITSSTGGVQVGQELVLYFRDLASPGNASGAFDQATVSNIQNAGTLLTTAKGKTSCPDLPAPVAYGDVNYGNIAVTG
jgi:hypothetical protein